MEQEVSQNKEDDMHRFYVSEEQVAKDTLVIVGSDVNHIKNVLRLSQGEEIMVCDGNSTDYSCRIVSIEPDKVLCQIERKESSKTELPARLYLFQALPKNDKMELVIQKAVELGAACIVPVSTSRCVVRLDEKKAAKKQERWQKIAEAASKQCNRGVIPEVKLPVSLTEAFDIAKTLEYNIMPYESASGMDEARGLVADALQAKSIGIFIGPEGGFEEEEVAQAVEAGCHILSLGKRILRTETAGLALLSVLMFHLEV